MASRGEFGKAYGSHRKSGGLLSRKEFAAQVWHRRESIVSEQTQENKIDEVEVQ